MSFWNALETPVVRSKLQRSHKSAPSPFPAMQLTRGSVGFFYLEGHGIPRAEVQQLHRLARDFFAQPQGLKDRRKWDPWARGDQDVFRFPKDWTPS